MSSPHVGGDFLNAMAVKGHHGSSGLSSSGRNTPRGGGSGRNTPLNMTPARSIPAQLANPYGRPQAIVTQPLSDDDEDGQGQQQAARGLGWRPITPSRSPKPAPDSPVLKQQNSNPYAPSSRNPTNDTNGGDDLQIQLNPNTAIDSSDLSQDGDTNSELPPIEVRFSSLPPVLKGYLLGQLACVIKFGIWWVGFTYLILALFGGSSYLVGGTRICFNLALLLCSPMAGGIAEKTNIKKLLNKTVLGRGIIYCMAIPVAWVLMESGLLWSTNTALHTSFFIVFLLIIFIDGIGVSFSNVADIDSGGVNLVAAQYGIEIDDNIRNYFNSLHIMFFDLSMVIFNPILAYIGLFIGQHTVANTDDDSNVGNVVDELTLLIAIGGVFLVSTILTLICYNAYMPDLKTSAPTTSNHDQIMTPLGDQSPNISMNSDMGYPVAEPDPLSWAQFKELAKSVREGASLTWANTRIRYRVLFFAVETSVEDAMIALIAAMIGSEIFAPEGERLHYAYGNLWGAGLVACGKSGGVIASIIMHRHFQIDPSQPNNDGAYKPLFWFAFLGGCCSLILPAAYYLRLHTHVSDGVTTALFFIGMFLFFLFSTLSKIGFSTLMQSMAAEVEATGRVFGFVAAFVTATDALILMGLASLFSAVSLELALWIACAFIATHGLVELVFGPGLVLKKPAPSLDDQLKMDLAQPLM